MKVFVLSLSSYTDYGHRDEVKLYSSREKALASFNETKNLLYRLVKDLDNEEKYDIFVNKPDRFCFNGWCNFGRLEIKEMEVL